MRDDNIYTAAEKDRAVTRKALDAIANGRFLSDGYEKCHNMAFIKVNGLTNFWKKDSELGTSSLMGDILSSLIRYNAPFAYVIVGNGDGISIYFGVVKIFREGLKRSIEAVFPGADIDIFEENPMSACPCGYGGVFSGMPTNTIEHEIGNKKNSLQIETICRGMSGRSFTYMVLAAGLSKGVTALGHDRILEEMGLVYSQIHQTLSGGAQGNISAEMQDFHSKNYFDDLEAMETYIKTGIGRGMWRVNGYYAADTAEDARQLGNLIKAAYSGEESKPEPFRITEYNAIKDVIRNTYMMADIIPNPSLHPLGRWFCQELQRNVEMYIYRFQTILNSNQLGVLCQLPTKEFPGYYIDEYVEFDVAARQSSDMDEPICFGDICVAGRKSSFDVRNPYLFNKNDFTRHALIIGITGGGKTNTSKSLLNTLWALPKWEDKVPFLVIESAKREYWELRNLKGFEDLLVFTLGDEAKKTSVKYRINPFEANPGISLQTHIDYLLSTFKAAFELYPPMPYVLETAVYEVYSDRGWDIAENVNRFGLTEYPTLSDLYRKIDVVVDRLGYHNEVQSNVKAALQARIHSLRIGGKGAMMDTPKSVPIGELLSRPVVMELEDLGDDETKSFVIGILLVQLYEYRKAGMTKGSKSLEHILMIEEAHRLLKNVSVTGEGDSTRAKSVEFFCNLLAEIRTFGQGIMIAEQIPTKLAPDTLKNTNLKIVHRTVAREDREAVGKAMNMSDDQMEYLSSLRRGYAAVYAEGDSRPKCVKFPLVEPFYDYEREEVLGEVRKKVYDLTEHYDAYPVIHMGCTFCEERCRYYEDIMKFLKQKSLKLEKIDEKWQRFKYRPEVLGGFLNCELMADGPKGNIYSDICILGTILDKSNSLNDGQRQKIIADFLAGKFKITNTRRN